MYFFFFFTCICLKEWKRLLRFLLCPNQRGVCIASIITLPALMEKFPVYTKRTAEHNAGVAVITDH